MPEGILLRGRGGLYDVQSDGQVWRCALRGKNRWLRQSVLPGDHVRFSTQPGYRGAIEAVLPRRNQLARPAVANVDRIIVVMALALPPVNRLLLDRLIVISESLNMPPALVFNKVDLVSDPGPLPQLYRSLGYRVMVTSTRRNVGIDELERELSQGVSVFAGPSGVGKSSLMNALDPGLRLMTAAVSQRIERGRHTTRHVELLPVQGGGFVADTPGFSQIDLTAMKRENLSFFFPEIAQRIGHCRFSSCLHRSEPACAVLQAVEAGEIDPVRYQHYLKMLDEVIKAEHVYNRSKGGD